MNWHWQRVAVVVLVTAVTGSAQAPRDFRKEAAQLIKVLDQNHFHLPVLDNNFSADILDGVINQLDVGHLYFNEKDIQALNQFRNSLDDEWRGSHWDFLQKLTDTYHAALVRGDEFRAAEIEKAVTWSAGEVFIPEGKNAPWSKNDDEQRKRWALWIKYKALLQLRETADSTAAVKGLDYVQAHEKEIRKHIGVVESRRTKRIVGNPHGFENYVGAVYFRMVTKYYDPHSLYLSPQEFENFKSAVSTKEFSFGLGLNEDENGNVLIEYLIPGAPAWKSGELHKGDVLLEFKWEGQEPFDLAGIGLDEFLETLDRSNPSSMELTVRQSNGIRKTVSLTKEKIQSEENTVKGFVLNGPRKIGYISLPGFYTQWGDDETSSCANDVAAEIVKLKGESIDGLILDIRSNGGGSMKEAIDMAGIFIDEGPLMMMLDKAGRIVTLKDINRGIVYEGPLILLINGESASASEILAGAIQDYHRGIIVGGASYGKATGQVIFSLDPANPQPSQQLESKNNFGFATVTEDRLYRVTGKSHQGTGVVPDIALPDLYGGAVFHENALRHAFPNDTVAKKVIYRALPGLPLPQLKNLSMERVHREPSFQAIAKLETELAATEVAAEKEVTLRWQDFLPNRSETRASTSIRTAPTSLYEVNSPEFNRIRIEMDSYLKEYTRQWIALLKEDPYVQEAYHIMEDYLKLKSKK